MFTHFSIGFFDKSFLSSSSSSTFCGRRANDRRLNQRRNFLPQSLFSNMCMYWMYICVWRSYFILFIAIGLVKENKVPIDRLPLNDAGSAENDTFSNNFRPNWKSCFCLFLPNQLCENFALFANRCSAFAVYYRPVKTLPPSSSVRSVGLSVVARRRRRL